MSAWVAVDKNSEEFVYDNTPIRENTKLGKYWDSQSFDSNAINLPKGSIKKLIGRDLTWNDEAVELKE